MQPLAVLPLVIAALLLPGTPGHASEDFAPYGTAKADLAPLPAADTVWDVNYDDPRKLHRLYGFIRSTRQHMPGKVVVVTHGPELRAFAKENYEQYQGVVDRMAELAQEGVEFRMCHDALQAAGFRAEDMHGFITVIPSGFAELVRWQARGYQYVNPNPLPVRDVRLLEQPSRKQ